MSLDITEAVRELTAVSVPRTGVLPCQKRTLPDLTPASGVRCSVLQDGCRPPCNLQSRGRRLFPCCQGTEESLTGLVQTFFGRTNRAHHLWLLRNRLQHSGDLFRILNTSRFPPRCLLMWCAMGKEQDSRPGEGHRRQAGWHDVFSCHGRDHLSPLPF